MFSNSWVEHPAESLSELYLAPTDYQASHQEPEQVTMEELSIKISTNQHQCLFGPLNESCFPDKRTTTFSNTKYDKIPSSECNYKHSNCRIFPIKTQENKCTGTSLIPAVLWASTSLLGLRRQTSLCTWSARPKGHYGFNLLFAIKLLSQAELANVSQPLHVTRSQQTAKLGYKPLCAKPYY